MSATLGALERVDPREAWPKEYENFTPWLASAEGLKLLSATLGIELAREAEEHPIGPFKLDILARRTDTLEEHWVVIENQLEMTDHRHLGQVLTYAAGVKAYTIIWVATKFVDDHRAAIDWLNEITDEKFQFFGLEIELWRIGSSPPAPKLNIVARPNNWSREVNETKRGEAGRTERGAMQLRYWEGLRQFLLERKGPLQSQKPGAWNWTNFPLERSGVWLTATVNSRTKTITAECQTRTSEAPGLYTELETQKEPIEREIGDQLVWDFSPDRDLQRIILRLPVANLGDETDWPRQYAWLASKLESLRAALTGRIRKPALTTGL
jgi:hypothetical protein